VSQFYFYSGEDREVDAKFGIMVHNLVRLANKPRQKVLFVDLS
jgi:hypothetical protein